VAHLAPAHDRCLGRLDRRQRAPPPAPALQHPLAAAGEASEPPQDLPHLRGEVDPIRFPVLRHLGRHHPPGVVLEVAPAHGENFPRPLRRQKDQPEGRRGDGALAQGPRVRLDPVKGLPQRPDLSVRENAVPAAPLEVLAHRRRELDAGGRVARDGAAVSRPVEELREKRLEVARCYLGRLSPGGELPARHVVEELLDVALRHLRDGATAPAGEHVGVELPAVHPVTGRPLLDLRRFPGRKGKTSLQDASQFLRLGGESPD
jgi:hypothetical protein